MEKIFASFVLILLSLGFAGTVFAADGAGSTPAPVPPASSHERTRGVLLPKTYFQTIAECEKVMYYVNSNVQEARDVVSDRGELSVPGLNDVAYDTDILGCAIKTGDIKLWMVAFYIRFFLEFVISIAGLLAVAGVVFGGYLYLFAGLADSKDKGKNAIKNSLIGLVLVLTAWGIVNIVIALVTL